MSEHMREARLCGASNIDDVSAYRVRFRAGNPDDYVVLRSSKDLEGLCNCSGDDLIGVSMSQCLPPDCLDVWNCMCHEAVSRRESRVFSLQSTSSDHVMDCAVFFFEPDMLMAVHSLSDCISASGSHPGTRGLDAIPYPAFCLSYNGKITLANSSACRLFGYTRESLESMYIQDVERGMSKEGWISRCQQVREVGRMVVQSIFSTMDGRAVAAEVSYNLAYSIHEDYCLCSLRMYSDQGSYAKQRIVNDILYMANKASRLQTLMKDLTGYLRRWLGCDAVGIRLRDGNDFPYFETCGFSEEFIVSENSLCRYSPGGHVPTGDLKLECLCGKVLARRYDPKLEYFTARGSFWTSDSAELMRNAAPGDWYLSDLRGKCVRQYASMALIPLIVGSEVHGLIQVGHRIPGKFCAESVLLLEEIAGIMTPVISRQLVEDELRSKRDTAKAILEAVPDVVFRFNRNGDCLDINRRQLDAYLAEPSGMRKKNIRDLVPEDTVELVLRKIHDTLLSGDIQTFQHTLKARGGMCTFEVRMAVCGEGEVVCVARDITQSKIREGQLMQARRLESIGRLTAGISHDFSNLLQTILGYTDLLLDNVDNGYSQHDHLEKIHTVCIRATDLIGRIQSLYRPQPAKILSVDVGDLAHEIADLVRCTFPKSIIVECCAERDRYHALCDSSQIHQVLMNLCMNARDAMPGGGCLRISVERVDFANMDVLGKPWPREGGFIRCVVSDDGSGMDDATRQNAFEPFFTTKSSDMGTGLGLSICHSVIRENGGLIDIDSTVGVGTSISIYLPVTGSPVAEIHEHAVNSPIQDCRILLVDDDEYIREFMSLILERKGFKVSLAANGPQALDILEMSHGCTDMVVLDLCMPGINGLRILSSIKQKWPDMRVIVSTGLDTGMECLPQSEQPDEVLHKPYAPKALLASISNLLSN